MSVKDRKDGMVANSQRSSQPRKPRRGRGRPFVPGQSGNPTGRPKKDPADVAWYEDLKAAVRAGPRALHKLAEKLEVDAEEARRSGPAQDGMPAKVANLSLAVQATKQAFDAHRELTDRFEGRPVQQQELTGADSGPLIVDFKWPQ